MAKAAAQLPRYFEDTAGAVEEWHFSTLPPAERTRVPPFRVPRFHRTLSGWGSASPR